MNNIPKKMPIGIQTLSEIINYGYLYIDKTKYIYELITQGGGYYFYSRPRRFGKSLTCSTLKSIFEGKKELFRGLWIYNSDWKWEEHPVILFSFNSIGHQNPDDLEKSLNEKITSMAKENNISFDHITTLKGKFVKLIKQP